MIAGYDINALQFVFAGIWQISAGKEALHMNGKIKAAVLAAALTGSLMTGCGEKHMNHNAEVPRATTPAASQSTRPLVTTPVTDRDNDLYEEDDVHRKTDTDEPDIIDRADSALDDAEDYVESVATDAKQALDSMTE